MKNRSIFTGYGSVNYFKYLIDFKSVIYKVIQTGAGNHRLNLADGIQQMVLPASIQFWKHIIQKEDGLIPGQKLNQL